MNGSQRVALIAVADCELALASSQSLGRLGYKVMLTAGGEAAAAGLRDEGLDTHFRRLDPTDKEEVAALVETTDHDRLTGRHVAIEPPARGSPLSLHVNHGRRGLRRRRPARERRRDVLAGRARRRHRTAR